MKGMTPPNGSGNPWGGTDDYESKLSLMPLVFGTLKGTLYALVFAVPVAVMAAIYTAHFMAPSVKRVVKPVMEIMASLPSVVLGFFGALYLAPRMEDKVPALLCMAVLIPGLAALIAWFWTTRPAAWRNKFSRGVEYIVMTPVILLCAWFCWEYLGLLAGTAPHQPLPRRHGTVGRGGLPGRQLRGPVAQRLRHAL